MTEAPIAGRMHRALVSIVPLDSVGNPETRRELTMQRLLTLVVLTVLLCGSWVVSVPAAAPGSLAKPRAEILWDTWGTPHIFADQEEEAPSAGRDGEPE
jgi:hypothetical protein